MEQTIYLSCLFDYYSELLTEKQKHFFEDYYFNNLTLAEIAENNNISRNAVHKTIKEVETKLFDYENKLKLFAKYNQITKIINTLDEEIKNKIIELI